MNMQEQQKARAQELRKAARENPGEIAEVLDEALGFVNRHSEDWYYSGQELCGKLEGAIDQFAGVRDSADILAHMIGCAKAAGFTSITEAIAVAKVARNPWTPVSQLPAEPGWYLVMLAPDNDWGLMSDTPLQVEFDAYKAKPKAFTCFYEYRGDEDITAAVLEWMPLPSGPVR